MNDLYLVQSGKFRLVFNSQRASKLRKRGEYIKWSKQLNGWIWEKPTKRELHK